MTISKAIATVLGCGIGGGALGGGLGFAIGKFVPGAYVAMFHLPLTGEINPVDIGLGLGTAQGACLGILVGVLLVAIVAWHDVRTKRPEG